MSLFSLMEGKQHRNMFKKVRPSRSLFGCYGPTEAFTNSEPEAPPRYRHTGVAGQIGTTFDYLIRFVIARARHDPFPASLSLSNVKIGLGIVLARDVSQLGNQRLCGNLLDPQGAISDDVYSQLRTARDSRRYRRRADRVKQTLDSLGESLAILRQFVAGEAVAEERVIRAAWLLAYVETAYRSGWIPETLDSFIAPPPDDALEDISGLWESFTSLHLDLFASAGECTYGPEFGDASRLVGGADADLLVDGMLIETKTTTTFGYRWRHVVQLVSYYVLAAMNGDPWPITRLGLYKPRYGRISYIDTKDLENAVDLCQFGHELIEVCSRPKAGINAGVSQTKARQDEHLKGKLGANLSKHLCNQ